jgi:hypothetical protein
MSRGLTWQELSKKKKERKQNTELALGEMTPVEVSSY